MKIRLIVPIILFLFVVNQEINAQTETEKRLMEIKARKAIAKEVTQDDNLNTMEREAEVGEDPCTIYDDENWYTAFNQKEGIKGDPQLANTLLRLNQEQLKMKIKGRYQAVVRDYFDQMDFNAQTSATTHIESAGEMVIEQILNDTRECCRKTSVPDKISGRIIMYMAIKINKKDLVEKIATGISNDKEAKVRFNEEKFRESAMKVFENDK
jgi:hypothetical protein